MAPAMALSAEQFAERERPVRARRHQEVLPVRRGDLGTALYLQSCLDADATFPVLDG